MKFPKLNEIITQNIWRLLLEAMIKIIKGDASEGLLQTGRFNYRSRLYMYEKSRGMFDGQVNTDVSNVNMTLTGRLFNGLSIRSLGENTAQLGYNANDSSKLTGSNKAYGDGITTLSEKNQKGVDVAIDKLIQAKLDEVAKEEVNISINI